MKKTMKKILSLLLVAVMTITTIPLAGFEAKAYNVPGYSAGAAAKWGREHINDVWSPLLGYGIWENGGDCANFVSQCLYMGGIDMTGAWHSNGCMRYNSGISDGVFIRAQQLHDYLVSIGGQSIKNPSVDQLSLGDTLFYKNSGASRCTHSAIVIDFENGQPVVAYHSILNSSGVYEIGRTTDIDLQFKRENTYLVKLNGSICTAQKSRDFDVYIAKKQTGLYNYPGGSGFIRNVLGSDYIHVYSTQYTNGSVWGYTFCRGYWGWVKLSDCNYNGHISTPQVNHNFGNWYVAKKSTCIENGYEQRDCTVCGHYEKRVITGGHVTKIHATCLEPGFCSLCGTKTEEPLGHNFGDWSFVLEPTCTEGGIRTHSCTRCGFEEQEDVDALGHDDVHVTTAPTCTSTGTATYACQRCGRQTINYIDSENTVSDWTPEVIEGLEPVETKTQYRFRDKSTKTSYSTFLDGWTQYGSEWVHAGSGSANFVYSWPSGFDGNNWYYQNFMVGPYSAYETATTKRDVSNIHVGYINAHWCRGVNNSSSSKNTLISQYYTNEFWKFHAFDSADNKATSIVENAYKYDDGYYCDTTYWWHVNLHTPYYWSTYNDYNKLFHYYQWSDWSDWSDDVINATSNREVETRTMYKYDLAALGHDFSVEGSRIEPTCTEPGHIGKTCSRCGALSPEAEKIAPLGHELYDEESPRGWYKTSEEDTAVIIWRRDCQRFCGYYEEKAENSPCIFELTETVDPTCEKDGKIVYVCKYHNEVTEDVIPALGHEPDNNWLLAAASSCSNGGKDGKEICHCIRHDDGVTCNKVFERLIPAPDHISVTDEAVLPTCTETGLTEGSHCSVCEEVIVAQKEVAALGHDDSGEWVRISDPDCDKDGLEHLYCVRETENGVCNALIKERIIPGTPAVYSEIKRVDSTCYECGFVEYTCDNCVGTEKAHGYIEILPLDPDNHAEGVWETLKKSEICEIPGVEICNCPKCGEMLDSREIAPQYEAHNWVTEMIASSCTQSGSIREYCTQCSISKDPIDNDPLGHDMSDWFTVTASTCTEQGLERRNCQRDGCEYYESNILEPINHAYEKTEDVQATCTESGYYVMVCKNDNSHMYIVYDKTPIGHDWNDGVIEPSSTCKDHGTKTYTCQNDNSHTYTEEVPLDENNHVGDTYIKDAKTEDCTNDGYTGDTYCSDCNVKLSDGDVIPAPGHDMSNWYTVTEATCTEKGLEKRECQRDNCDYTEERETAIDPDNHYAETFYTVDEKADCENDGKKSHHCERCDESLDEVVISKRDHVYDNGVVTTAPTCTEDGIKTYTCTNAETEEYNACAHSYTETISATGHNWGEWETVTPATCTGDGHEKRVCKNDARHVEENVLTAIGHAWDDGVIAPSSTCKDHGTKTYTCQNDASHTYTEEVPLDENNHVGDTYIKDAKTEDCTNDGYTGDTYCSDCNVKLSDGEVIHAPGHDMSDWCTVTEAICTKKGLEKRECQRDNCDYTEERETAIDPDNHYAETFYTVDEKADCENDGKKSHHCERCDESLDEVVISKRDHVYDNGVVTTAPTCTEDGIKTYTCTNAETEEYNACAHSYTETISATGHNWGEWETVKEPTYTEMGEEKRECSKCDAKETKSLPVLTRPSDENENIETEKTVEYDSATGEAVIKLLASSKGEKITVNSRTPLDIVLVLDQSGSMEGDLLKKLKTATENFTNAIYADAVENGIDHRIAMAGFAMQDQYNFGSEYPQYLNTEVLTTGGSPIKYNSLSTSKMNEVYKNALVSVNIDGNLNPILTLAKNNLEAKGATAADLGLDMACQIFSQNENDGSRKRIVVFMTDGVPTYKSDYMEETATNANNKANLLKNAYEADLYSVGVLSGSGANTAKTFLNNIASKDANGKALYFDSANADKLVEDFKDIATQSTTTVTDFADITLIDTVSNAFTLTAVQEKELRQNAIEKLGITNDDITITRFADSTTEVKLEHINPEAVPNGNDINYVIDFSFSVTANEKALIEGSYSTNTDNAGVIIGTNDVYENNFVVPSTNIENAEGVVYFTVNGITYHVVRVHKGDSLDAPEFTLEGEYTFSGWDIPEEVVFDGGKLTVDATLIQKEYTVTWNTADGEILDTYYAGDIIIVPEIGLNSKGEEFLGWNSEVSTVMPGEDLEFTAIYGKHEHTYTENVLVKVSCGVTGKVRYTCSCGDSYTETVDALEHEWSTSATSSDGSKTAYSYIYCENCGESPDKSLSYTVQKSSWNTVTCDLKLVDANSITVQPDGSLKISLPLPPEMNNARSVKIYRVEEDGTKTNLNGTVKNGYITFITTHFSIYIIEAVYDCDETGNHTDDNSDNICDICGDNLKVETPEKPSENCSHMCHSNNGLVRFFWKIFNFFNCIFNIKSQRYCNCGIAHW